MSEKGFSVRLSARIDSYLAAMAQARAATKAVGTEGAAMATGLSGSLQRLRPEMQRVGGWATTHISMPLALAGGAAVKMSTDFDQAFAQMVGLAGVASGEVDGLKESILALSGRTAVAPQELAEALYFAKSAGLDTAGAMKAVEAAAIASASGMGSAADVVGLSATAVAAYGEGNMDAARATDILTAAVREGRADPKELASSLGTVLPVAAQLGITFEEAAGTVAFLSNGLGSTSGAVNSARDAFTKMLTPSQQGRDALLDMGTSVDELHAAIEERGLMGALDLLRSKGFGENQQALKALFEDSESFRGALLLLNDESGRLVPTLDATANSAGAAGVAFDAAAGTDGFKLTQAWTDMKVALIEAGAAIAPVISDIAGGVAGLIRGFTSLPEPVQKIVLIFLAMALAFGPLLKIASGLLAMRGAFLALRAVMIAHPLLTLAVVVGGLAAAFGLFSDDVDHSAERVRNLRDAIIEAGSVMGGLTQYIIGLASESDLVRQAMAGAGVTASEFATAVSEGGQPLAELYNRLNDAADAAGFSKAEMIVLSRELGDLPGVAAGATTAVDEMGMVTGEAAEKTRVAADMYGEFAAAMREAAKATGESSDGVVVNTERHEELNRVQSAARDVRFRLTQAELETAEAAEAEAKAQDEARAAAERFTMQAAELDDELRNVASALDKLIGRNLTMEEANQALYDGVVAMNEAFFENGLTLDIATEAGRTNRDAVKDQVENILAHGQALIGQGASQEEATAAIEDGRQALLDQLLAYGLDEEAAKAYIDQLGLTPENIATAVDLANTEEMKAEIADIIDRLGPVDDDRETHVQALIDQGKYAEALALLKALERDIKPRVTPTWQAVVPPKFDTGGIVPGPRGSAQLILAHGGETVLPTHKSSFTTAIAPWMSGPLTSAGPSFNINAGGGGTGSGSDPLAVALAHMLSQPLTFVIEGRPVSAIIAAHDQAQLHAARARVGSAT